MRIRLALPKPRMARLAPKESDWVLTIGEGQETAAEPLALRRTVDEDGRTAVSVPLADSSGVHWFEEGSRGRAHRGHRRLRGAARHAEAAAALVEFAVLPTLHGLAVTAGVDDLVVRSGIDGATISRGSACPCRSRGPSPIRGAGRGPAAEAVIRREGWIAARGDVLETARELLRASRGGAAAAPRGRTPRRRAGPASPTGLRPKPARSPRGPGGPAARGGERAFELLRGVAALRMLFLPPKALLGAPVLAEIRRGSPGEPARRGAEALGPGVVLPPAPPRSSIPTRMTSRAASARSRRGRPGDARLRLYRPASSAMRQRCRRTSMCAVLLPGPPRPEAPRPARGRARRLPAAPREPARARPPRRRPFAMLNSRSSGGDGAVRRRSHGSRSCSVVWRGGEVEPRPSGGSGGSMHGRGPPARPPFPDRAAHQPDLPGPQRHPRAARETARLFEDLFLSTVVAARSRAGRVAGALFRLQGVHADQAPRRRDRPTLASPTASSSSTSSTMPGSLLQHQVDHRLFGAARADRSGAPRDRPAHGRQARPGAAGAAFDEAARTAARRRPGASPARGAGGSRTCPGPTSQSRCSGRGGAEIDRLRADILWNGRR